MPNGVLILAEVENGAVVPVTAELIGAAQRLNAGPVSAMLLGSGVEAQAGGVTGAEKVYVVDDAALALTQRTQTPVQELLGEIADFRVHGSLPFRPSRSRSRSEPKLALRPPQPARARSYLDCR